MTIELPPGTGNGCTGFPDGDWRHCCDAHDFAYSTLQDKLWADLDLAVCVAQTGHPGVAILMLLGVSIFGWWFYKQAQKRSARSKSTDR